METTEIILLLKYFRIFRHPLKPEEIYKCSSAVSMEQLTPQLDELETQGIIKMVDGFYLYDGDESFIHKRLAGEKKAQILMPKARKAGRLIARFPFVKFVGISGSLSKNYADEKTDFDFFIVTANNTLWICRTLLHLFKKLSFLAGKQHSFCMNYFIDENHMKIEEQNIFTRIELSTLIPLNNETVYRSLLFQNRSNLPNINHLMPEYEMPENQQGKGILSQTEKNKWLKPLNVFLMRMTDAKWKRKWKNKGYPMEDYPLAFKTTPFVSKNHPKNYQKNILNQLQHNQQ
jgi:hypothetical protein